MLVSIVLLCRNQAPYVDAAIRSVMAQSHAELELLVVDDASTDGSAAALRAICAREDVRRRFNDRIVSTFNDASCGVAESLNRTIAAARGDIVSLLNADDLYDARRIEHIAAAVARDNADLAFTGMRALDARGAELPIDHPFVHYLRTVARYIESVPSVGFSFVRYNACVTIGNLAFRRGLFEALGGFRRLQSCHAWDFSLRALLLREPVYIEAPLYGFRLYDTKAEQQPSKWLAAAESDAMLRDFMAAVRSERYANPRTPSPRNWPGIFERLVAEAARWPYWADMR